MQYKTIKNTDLTNGIISKNILFFALPLMIGNLIQQFYNIADTLIVGKYIGENALAAVGSAYTLMILLTSIISGLCMGSSVFFSIQFGRKAHNTMKQSFFISFVSIAVITALLNLLAYICLNRIINFMNIPTEIRQMFRQYLFVIFSGIFASFLYNFFSSLLRSVGNSIMPLMFLTFSAIINVVLDLVFILCFNCGVVGAAVATVIAQYISAIGIMLYYFLKCSNIRISKIHIKWNYEIFRELAILSAMTCIQQSIMNLGILMVQGLVNSFGTSIMAAFAAGVKIDTVAYSPLQDFGNAFSTFIAQNYGAGKKKRIRQGLKTAGTMVIVFCIFISSIIYLFSDKLMTLFVDKENIAIISIGTQYLHIESVFYIGIGILFMLYGYYRAIKKPSMSIVLTIVSLGTRVVLAYILSSISDIGVIGIWVSIPIGWALADIVGIIYGLISTKTK